MEASFDEQVHEAIASCIGEAALKVLMQGGELTADTVAHAIRALAGDEPDIGRGFALLLLKKSNRHSGRA